MGGIDIVDFNSVLLNILKVSFLSEMPIEAMQAHLRNTTCLLRHFKCVWAHRPLDTSMGHNLITFVLDRLCASQNKTSDYYSPMVEQECDFFPET